MKTADAGAPRRDWAAALAAARDLNALRALAAKFTAGDPPSGDPAALRTAWDEALWRIVRAGDGVAFALELLDLPPHFQRLGWLPLSGEGWPALVDQLDARLSATPAGEELHFRLQLARLLLRALSASPAQALAETARALSQAPKRMVPREIGHRLQRMGWHREMTAEHLDALRAALPAPGAAARWRAAQTILNLLAFDRGSTREWTPRVFTGVVLPWLRAALAEGDYNLALQLENRAMKDYATQTETSAHHNGVVSRWLPAMLDAGRRLHADPPPIGDGSRIGFVLVTSSIMAHTQVLLGLLQGLTALDPPPLSCHVYIVQMTEDALPRRLDALGVPWTRLDCRDETPERDAFQRLLLLREALHRDRIDTAAFVSTEVLMPFAFAMRIAPVQIWFSWKYHGLCFEEIDGYITGGSLGETLRNIDGRQWRTVPGSAVDLHDPALAQEAARLRRGFGDGHVVLGSIARPEKVHTEPFLDALGQILRANPHALYLWFGRRAPAPLLEAFRARGIAERCMFQGWVDPKLYAQVLDVHLDTFPFPGGLTHIQAMAAGTAGVLYLNDESRQNGILQLLWPVFGGETGSPQEHGEIRAILAPADEPLFPVARNTQEYIDYAQRLIDDPGYRHRVGEAGRRAIEFVVDDRRTARVFARHVHEIIAEARARQDRRGRA